MVFEYTERDQTILEQDPLKQLARDKHFNTYCNQGFWQCMDTLCDRTKLEGLRVSGNAPWKLW
jgi:glucose-1-phosphate cytidylyltransferase